MQKLALIFLLTLSLLLSGCFDVERRIKNGSFNKFIVIENPRLRSDGLAKWDWERGVCIIQLKKYPFCLKHEVMHCLEGYWHDERPNGEYCK